MSPNLHYFLPWLQYALCIQQTGDNISKDMLYSALLGKKVFSFKSSIISSRTCSPSFSDALKMGFLSVAWERLRGWLFSAFFRKLTVSWSGILQRFVFTADKHRFVTWEDGLHPRQPEGLSNLCYWSQILTTSPQASLQAEHLCLAPSHLLKCIISLLSKPAPQQIPGYPETCTEIWDMAPAFRNHQQGAHGCSRTSWKVDPVEGGRRPWLKRSTALLPSASVLWVSTDILEPWGIFHL